MQGCERHGTDRSGFAEAIAAARGADAVVFVGGLQASDEEEDTDRPDLKLTGVQLELISAIYGNTSVDVPIVVVIVSGGPISEPSIMGSSVDRGAVVWLSYFGQDGSGAVDVLLGKESPSGRLPWTVPMDVSQLPSLDDYRMNAGHGRTHRYLDASAAPPLFPFAWGLSYANVTTTLSINPASVQLGQNFTVTINLVTDKPTNHVVPLFASHVGGGFGGAPLQSLVNFEKLPLAAGTPASVTMKVNAGEDLLLGIDQQPLPGIVKMWTGDALCRGPSCSQAELRIARRDSELVI